MDFDPISKIERVKFVLIATHLKGIQAFNCRNVVGDFMKTLYKDDEIQIDYCPGYQYIEVFGVSDEELEALAEEGYIR